MAVAEETIYRVVTQYVLEERGTTGTQQKIAEIERSTARAAGSMRSLGLGFGSLLGFVGPLALISAGVAAVAQGFRNMNAAVESNIQLAAQFNLAFKFDPNPAQNWLAAMAQGRKFAGEIIKDATRMPGTSREFLSAAGALSGPIFSAGGNTDQIRRIIGNVVVTGKAALQSPEEASRQAQRILTGQVSQGDNPLFAFMSSNNLLPKVGLNAMSATERLKKFDDALRKFVTPEVLGAISGTFDTQWSTLQDQILGSQGAFGQAYGGEYGGFIDMLKDWNAAIQNNMPAIIGAFRILIDEFGFIKEAIVGMVGLLPRGIYKDLSGGAADSLAGSGMRSLFGRSRFGMSGPDDNQVLSYLQGKYQEALSGKGAGISDLGRAVDTVSKRLAGVRGGFGIESSGSQIIQEVEAQLKQQKAEGETKGTRTASNVVNQTFNIKLDLHRDESPEGIAVKLRRHLAREMQNPTVPGRSMPIGPGMSGIR